MHSQRLIRMVLNRLLGPALSAVNRRGKDQDMSPQERRKAQPNNQTMKQVQKALRASRRIGRF